MTPSCYDCLPPLAAKMSMAERIKCINCRQALKTVEFVSDEVKNDEALTKWVYNVVETRSLDVGGEKIIIPMADMVSLRLCYLLLIHFTGRSREMCIHDVFLNGML